MRECTGESGSSSMPEVPTWMWRWLEMSSHSSVSDKTLRSARSTCKQASKQGTGASCYEAGCKHHINSETRVLAECKKATRECLL